MSRHFPSLLSFSICSPFFLFFLVSHAFPSPIGTSSSFLRPISAPSPLVSGRLMGHLSLGRRTALHTAVCSRPLPVSGGRASVPLWPGRAERHTNDLPPPCHLAAPPESPASASASSAACAAVSIERAVGRCWTHQETTNYRHRSTAGAVGTWRDDNG